MNPLLNPLTSTERLALSLTTADEGYATFDTTLNNIYFWDGSAWITSTGSGGTVTSVGVSPGTGISASVANPTTTPVITITNTAPDQTVVLNNGTGISVSGTYPNFTITNTSPSSGGTVTGSGTLNYISKWTPTGTALGDSQIFDDGSGVMVNTTTNNSYKFDINGSARVQTNLVVGPINAILVDTNYALRVNTPLSGAVNAFGVFSDGEVQSDVTNNTHYFRSVAKTTASSFTLTNLNHFSATQGTFGAGSTVGFQFGFRAFSSLVGATTNNFGYYGEIPLDGTKNWNIYMLGTAPNYFNGNVLIGTTTNTGGYKLNVNGTFYTSGINTLGNLAGTGTRMVVASNTGVLSTQAIPTGGGSTGFEMNFLLMGA
jgi:hypothetical protein